MHDCQETFSRLKPSKALIWYNEFAWSCPMAIRIAGEVFKGYNQPKRDVQSGKQFSVAARENGKVRLVRFGDPNMENKSDNPERRKAFRSRHSCDERKSKLTPGYWSCKAW